METTKKKKKTLHEIWKARYLYILLLPLLVWLAVFCYAPMYGVLMAFKNYSAKLGVMGSPWVGLQHFKRIFITPDAIRSINNTIVISASRLLFEFPMPIIMAIMITEMPGNRTKKIYQTIFTFPHFLSWVVVANIVTNFMAQGGAINILLDNLGFEKINFLTTKPLFRPLLYITSNWKEMGWSAIIYMAAIAGIDTTLYEAAKVDGAGHLRIFWQIMMPLTKPAMVSSAVLSFITIWNDYLSALIFLVNKKTYTVALAVRYWLFDDAQRYELTMASAASTIIPVVILFIFCQKYFVEGIATSGVKG